MPSPREQHEAACRKFSDAIRGISERLDDAIERKDELKNDTCELLRCLDRFVRKAEPNHVGRRTILNAMGSPGDWGYESPMGMALKAFCDIDYSEAAHAS